MNVGAKVLVETERYRPTPRLVEGVVIEVCERLVVVECEDGIVRSVRLEQVRL